MNSDPHRNQAGRRWEGKAAIFSISATFAAIVAGAVLGAAGGAIPFLVRIAAGSVLAVVAIVVGALDLGGHQVKLLQCNRETPQRWVHAGARRWALRNGAMLGIGATSRLGFSLWYVVPVAALLFGQANVGALIFGTYGLTRGGMVWPIIFAGMHRFDGNVVSQWLLAQRQVAHWIAAAQMIIVGAAVVIAVGL